MTVSVADIHYSFRASTTPTPPKLGTAPYQGPPSTNPSRHPLLISGIFHHPNSSQTRYGSVSGTSFNESDLACLWFVICSKSTLIDVSNGLLLFAIGNTFYVCNPVTNRWTLTPTPPKQALISVLAFDPYRSRHYKVVSFTAWEPRGAHLEVFSSQSGNWAEQNVHWDAIPNDAISANMHYFNGALYILAHPRYMLRLDLEKMTCRKMELSALISHVARVGFLGGQVNYASSEGGGVTIWMVEDEKRVLKQGFTVSSGFNLLGFGPERVVAYALLGKGKLVGYGIGKKKLDGVWDLKGEMEGAIIKQSWVFPHSRYLLDCMTDLQ